MWLMRVIAFYVDLCFVEVVCGFRRVTCVFCGDSRTLRPIILTQNIIFRRSRSFYVFFRVGLSPIYSHSIVLESDTARSHVAGLSGLPVRCIVEAEEVS